MPFAGMGIVAVSGAYFLLRRKPEDPNALERERRSYLNKVGRIVEGYIVEISDPSRAAEAEVLAAASAASESNHADSANAKSVQLPVTLAPDGSQRLLYYSYSISGVTYETAQDITGLEARAHLSRVAAGQTASVKYDPSNPSNSILVADDWSGLH